MTGNAYQNFRQKFIEDRLRNKYKDFTKKDIKRELLEEYESLDKKPFSDRTFETDWQFIKNELKEEGLSLKSWKKGKQWFYRYSDTEFSIFNQGLSKDEIKKLTAAVKLLQQVKGIDLNNELLDILHKLDTQVKYYKHNNELISFQETVIASNYEYVDDLYDAITEETVVEFIYKPFNEEAQKRIVHPYFLKQYNNRWFLLGYSETKNNVSTFALDRIQSKIKPLQKIYILPDGLFNAKEYFKDIIGVTHYPNEPAQKIVLLFSRSCAPYILTKPLHTSQEVIEKLFDGSIKVCLYLKRNYELVNTILGFGKDVTVLQPQSLAEEIKMQAEEILKKYYQ